MENSNNNENNKNNEENNDNNNDQIKDNDNIDNQNNSNVVNHDNNIPTDELTEQPFKKIKTEASSQSIDISYEMNNHNNNNNNNQNNHNNNNNNNNNNNTNNNTPSTEFPTLSLPSFLSSLKNDYDPTIPDIVIQSLLERSGCQCSDPALLRLISLSCTRFLHEIAQDCRISSILRTKQQQNTTDEKTNHTTSLSSTSSSNSSISSSVLTVSDISCALSLRSIPFHKPEYLGTENISTSENQTTQINNKMDNRQ